jgi:hypothetical protein
VNSFLSTTSMAALANAKVFSLFLVKKSMRFKSCDF